MALYLSKTGSRTLMYMAAVLAAAAAMSSCGHVAPANAAYLDTAIVEFPTADDELPYDLATPAAPTPLPGFSASGYPSYKSDAGDLSKLIDLLEADAKAYEDRLYRFRKP